MAGTSQTVKLPVDQETLDSPLNAKDSTPVLVETLSAQNNISDDEFSWTNRSFGFWMIIVASFLSDFLCAFDMAVVSTALPTIVQDLGGDDFIWVGSAYALAGSAIVPLCGGLVSIWGRKPILLILMTLMAIGSAVSGSAKSLSVLIIGRAFQGFGACGTLTVTNIIYADMIPLPKRGLNQAMAAVVWAFATGIGPPLGGILANAGAWRWLFYLNLPLFGIAFALEIVYLNNTPPKAAFSQQLRRMDWIGSVIVIGGSASFILALSWGGIRFAWSDARTLVPLIIGIVVLLGFLAYEKFLAKDPIIPWSVFATRSSVVGYIGTAIHGMALYIIIYYLPVFYQAVKLTSTVRSGVYFLGLSMFITPTAFVSGISIMLSKRYLPQNYLGWIFMVSGAGILAILGVNSSKAACICAPIVVAMGLGIGWNMTMFPILASLPYSNNAHALSFLTFVRNLSQTMGVAIGGTILQNRLTKKLPASYISQLPSGVSFAYSAIPTLRTLEPDLQLLVRQAFADSLKFLWLVTIGITGIGLVSVLLMQEIPLHNSMDDKWVHEKREKTNGVEVTSN